VIALDTNVIVRFLVRDDEAQAQAVYARLRQAEADHEALFVPLLVMLEVIRVLGSAYGKTRPEILSAIEDMKRMPIFAFERDEVIQALLIEGRRSTVDFADILIAHAAQESGCDSGLTFDRKAARLAFFRILS